MDAISWVVFGLIGLVVVVISRLSQTDDRVEQPSEKYGTVVIDWMFG